MKREPIKYPPADKYPKIDKFIKPAERIANRRTDPQRSVRSRIFIAVMNTLTSQAGLRVLGPHDETIQLLPDERLILDEYAEFV